MANMSEILAQDALQRQAAWNTEFLLENGEAFAGLYIAPTNDIKSESPELTFQMMLDHLLSSFDFEMARKDPDGKYDGKWGWSFMPADDKMHQPDKRLEFSFPGVYGASDDWSMDVHMQAGRYYLVRHEKACQDDLDCYGTFEDIKAHVFKECSIHVTQATPKIPSDFRPFTPLVPIDSDVSGDSRATWGDFSQNFRGTLAEGVTEIDATASMRKFHDDSTLEPQHQVCAISGLSTEDGNRLHISHIIPTQHYHVYPISGMQECDVEPDANKDDYTAVDKWDMTWDREFNGIALLNAFHKLWVSRFWAIDPDTLTIAVMAPYDILIPYHGQKAYFPEGKTPDKQALRWHYRMCMLESLNARSAKRQFHRPQSRHDHRPARDRRTPAFTLARRGRGRASPRANGSDPSPTSPQRRNGASPKRKHDTLSLREPSPHGDSEHPDNMLRVFEIDTNCLENLEESMAVMAEFTRRLRPSASGSRGSASP